MTYRIFVYDVLYRREKEVIYDTSSQTLQYIIYGTPYRIFTFLHNIIYDIAYRRIKRSYMKCHI